MKHSREHYEKELRSLSAQLDVEVTKSQSETLITYLELLLKQNETLNLTRIEDFEEALRLHIVDSLSALPYLHAQEQSTFADLGTGGGLPGIPIAVVSGHSATLVESVKKKAVATEEFVKKLEMSQDVEVFPGRSEELALERPEVYNFVIARALTSLPSLLELSAPLLRYGGKLIAMKAQPEDAEKQSAVRAAVILGMSLIETHEFLLPKGLEHRTIYVYRKDKESEVSIPRRIGKAQKSPLA